MLVQPVCASQYSVKKFSGRIDSALNGYCLLLHHTRPCAVPGLLRGAPGSGSRTEHVLHAYKTISARRGLLVQHARPTTPTCTRTSAEHAAPSAAAFLSLSTQAPKQMYKKPSNMAWTAPTDPLSREAAAAVVSVSTRPSRRICRGARAWKGAVVERSCACRGRRRAATHAAR